MEKCKHGISKITCAFCTERHMVLVADVNPTSIKTQRNLKYADLILALTESEKKQIQDMVRFGFAQAITTCHYYGILGYEKLSTKLISQRLSIHPDKVMRDVKSTLISCEIISGYSFCRNIFYWCQKVDIDENYKRQIYKHINEKMKGFDDIGITRTIADNISLYKLYFLFQLSNSHHILHIMEKERKQAFEVAKLYFGLNEKKICFDLTDISQELNINKCEVNHLVHFIISMINRFS